MIKIRHSLERGFADHGWLKSFHSFSFADYYDAAHMGFSVLRVINEDVIQGGTGFGTHPHRDMEIVTYVLKGALEHKDSMGHSEVLRPGEVQYMCAGTGVRHSEFNHFKDQDCHLLQIWLLPDRGGHRPEYQQKDFAKQIQGSKKTLVVSPDGREGSLSIHQDALLYVLRASAGETLELPNGARRSGYAQVIEGELSTPSLKLAAGDALMLANESPVGLKIEKDAHLLYFDLP
jgi:redox-sensitive bicupin YhaK (pirin superfamily)